MASKIKKIIVFGLIPVVVLGIGAAVMLRLMSKPASAKVTRPEATPTPVEVMTTRSGDRPTVVRAQGTVVPAKQITLQAEVSGRIRKVSKRLRPGGQFRAGQLMVRIDDRDYRLAVEQRKADVDRASLTVEVQHGRKVVAERDFRLARVKVSDPRRRALMLRDPQMRKAESDLKAARAGLELARIQASRTRITAPFNLMVQSRSVDVGQVVRPGQTLATLVGTDAFWVKASVPAAELAQIHVPGAVAKISQDVGGRRLVREARVIQLLGEVEPTGLMARLLLEVRRPLSRGELPLLLGSFVNIEISGRPINGVHQLPRSALRDGDTVWTVGRDGKLAINEVQVVRRQRDTVLVRGGLQDGARVVTSRLATPVAGMRLAVREQQQGPSRRAMSDSAQRPGGEG
jgi:RND family efflux transporter MFP subunit